jgi:hypothetical protein
MTSLMDGKIRHSPQYIDFEFKVWETKGSLTFPTHTGKLHVCNDDDYKKLKPVRKSMQQKVNDLKE